MIHRPRPEASRAAVLVALALGLVACSSASSSAPAQLAGPNDLALVGDLLFVTSTDLNELRVLDLAATPRDFVRAPNPIEPLSIPVLDRPVELARDQLFADGGTGSGPYVYARGTGSSEISIVSTDSKIGLKEEFRLPTAATVTALAAQGPTISDANSTLFFATFDGADGTLWKLSVPPLAAIGSFSPSPQALVTTPGEAIRALALKPPSGSVTSEVAVEDIALGTRAASAACVRTELLHLSDFSTLTLHFPFPVRKLKMNPAYSVVIDPKTNSLESHPAGERIFGLLDEESCGGYPDCSGLLAVEASSGQVSLDLTNNPMVPLQFGLGLIQDFTLQSDGRLVFPGLGAQIKPLLGIATTSGDSNLYGGSVYWFDADGLRPIDTDPAGASVSSVAFIPSAATAAVEPAGGLDQDVAQGPNQVKVVDGLTPSEVVSITFEGPLPGFQQQPSTDADGAHFVVPGAPFQSEVQVGDLLRIERGATACQAADGGVELFEVASIDSDGNGVTTTTDPTSACPNRTSFSLFASGAQPWGVLGSERGFLGRTSTNTGFNFTGCPAPLPYCTLARGQFHPDGFVATEPPLQFQFGPGPTVTNPGDTYLLSLDSHAVSLFFTLDPSIFPGWTFPSPVVYYRKSDQTLDRVFVGYPSSQGVLEIEPGAFVPNAPNAANLVGYR